MAAVFALAVQPAALAMPALRSAAIHATDCASHEATGCDHSMSKQDQGKPCKDVSNCLGMVGCAALAAVSHAAVAALPLRLTGAQSWQLNDAGPGITLQPDNPPPIV